MRGWLIGLMLFSSIPALAEEQDDEPRYYDDELYAEAVHADLPLYDFGWEDFWPRNFYRDGSFGCETRVSYGDWEFTPNPIDEFGDSWWMRITNYGVFHCAANIVSGSEREDLADGEFSRGFFVRLGETQREGTPLEIWAMQEGFRIGSDYILLAREPADGIVQGFTVLQRRCPEDAMRELEHGLDVWKTSYCALNSRQALWDLAIAMLDYPALGTLDRKGENDWVPDRDGTEAIEAN